MIPLKTLARVARLLYLVIAGEMVFIMGWLFTPELSFPDRFLIILGGEMMAFTFLVMSKWHQHAEAHDGA